METRPGEQFDTDAERWQQRVELLRGYLGIHALTPPQYDWESEGLCTQLFAETFFPEKGGSVNASKKVCGDCEVRAECLDRALLHNEEDGVWGGLSTTERRKLPDAIKRVY